MSTGFLFQNDDVYEVMTAWCKEHHQEAHLAVLHNYVARTISTHLHNAAQKSVPATRPMTAAAAAV